MYYNYIDIQGSTRYAGNKYYSYIRGAHRFSMRRDCKHSYRVRYIRNRDYRMQLVVL